MNMLTINNIDDFNEKFIVHVELEALGEERVCFAKNIDEEDYNSKYWLVMVSFNSKDKTYINNELYYISNNGLVSAEKQLSQEEIINIINFIRMDRKFIEWK